MKVFSVLMCFCVVHVSASFYDQLSRAVHSVESGFGKLLSDVVVDVTDTVHCTLSAVDQVLTLNGLKKNRSPYRKKCIEEPLKLPPIDERFSDDPVENFIKTRDALVNSSVVAVDTKVERKKIESISRVLKEETEELSKVSTLLKHELNTISQNVNSELEKIDTGGVKEKSVLDRPNTGQFHQPDRQPSQDIKEDHSKQTQQNSFNVAKTQFENRINQNESPANKFPKTFKEVAQNIREQNNLNSKSVTGSVFNLDSSSRTDPSSPFYDPAANSKEDHSHDVLSIIQESQRNDEIMEMFKQSHDGTDVFSSGSFLNF